MADAVEKTPITVTIELTPDEAKWLYSQAGRYHVEPSEIVRRLVHVWPAISFDVPEDRSDLYFPLSQHG